MSSTDPTASEPASRESTSPGPESTDRGSTGLPHPLVLLHGLWDTPRLFSRLSEELRSRRPELEIFAPHLPHRLGSVPLRELARSLAGQIEARFPSDATLDLCGFSMGGVIGRIWLQEHGGHRRIRRFFCVGSPQRGTLAAQLAPQAWLAGIADMKVGSPLLRELDRRASLLEPLDCRSLFCATDLTVFPGWRAVLPVGSRLGLPVLTHRQLIRDPLAVRRLADLLLEP